MKKIFLSIGLVCIIFLTAQTFADTPVSGCMDNTAYNYNGAATEDDGSCVYAVQPTLIPGDGEVTITWTLPSSGSLELL